MKKALSLLICLLMLFAVTAAYAEDCGSDCNCSNTSENCCDNCCVCCCNTCENNSNTCSQETFHVTYEANDCLAAVPTDGNSYAAGQLVNVLFDPVAYKDYLIFYGWDMDNDGVADFGYNYNTFTMPNGDVTLKAICIPAWSGGYCNNCDCGYRGCGVHLRDFYNGPIVYRNFPNRNLWPFVW